MSEQTTAQLVANMRALVSLDEAGALIPHGTGGHARQLLTQAADRLDRLVSVDRADLARRLRAQIAFVETIANELEGQS